MSESAPKSPSQSLLIVDDDTAFTGVLARAMSVRGYTCSVANNATMALQLATQSRPAYCVLDLKLGESNGLKLIPELLRAAPGMRILLLTGYASIATAVEAIKRGAHDYLAKPADADQIARALNAQAPRQASAVTAAPHAPPPLKRLEWEHIQRILGETEGNISEAARRLGMHRRTLQRKLAKHPVRERPAPGRE